MSEPPILRSQRWSDRIAAQRPLAARQGADSIEAISKRPANDDLSRPQQQSHHHQRLSPRFVGSRYFWAAVIATAAFCLMFAGIMGFTSSRAIGSLLRNPVQYSPFLLSVLVIAAIQWLLAMSAHRQAVSYEMWRRMMAVADKLNEPGPGAEEGGRNLAAGGPSRTSPPPRAGGPGGRAAPSPHPSPASSTRWIRAWLPSTSAPPHSRTR